MNDAKFIVWQVNLWDRFAKSSPFLLIFLIGLFYLLGFRDWNLFLYICLGLFVSVIIVWWFWVIYTIAVIAYTINNSGKRLTDVVEDIKEIQKTINDRKNRPNR